MVKFVLFAFILLGRLSLFADASQGESLERQLWGDIKSHKWNDLENKIAPYFQIALFDEILDKEKYRKSLKSYGIACFLALHAKKQAMP